MAKKQSSDELSKIASRVLRAKTKPPLSDSKKLAASVLGQDETRGARNRILKPRKR